MAKPETKMVAVPVDLELHRRIRVAAARNDLSMADWIRKMLEYAARADEKRHE